MRKLAAALALMAAAPIEPAAAQTVHACQGRIVVDTIYQSSAGSNNFEYFFDLRNATRSRMTVDVSFSGFPATVTLVSLQLPGIPIGPNATTSGLKFGRGTSGQVTVGTVARVYDAPPGAGPTVRLTNCRAG